MTTTITTLKCGDREVEIIATISCVFRESDIRGFAKAYNEDFEEDECDPEEVADRVMGEDFEYASMEEALKELLRLRRGRAPWRRPSLISRASMTRR